MRLAVQGAALRAGELVSLLGGDSERMRVQRLGFELEEVEHAGA